MLKAIFFDAAGTLIHLPRGAGWHYALVARRHGGDFDEAALDRAFHAVFREMIAHAAANGLSHGDDRAWWRELVFRVLDACGGGPPGFGREAYFGELYAHFAEPGVWELYPEVGGVLAGLGKNYRLAVISNFDKRLRAILDGLGVAAHFEHLVISGEIGVEKPAPQIFGHALELMGVAPHEALHVGDHPVHDWQGAEAVGMRVFRLERPRNDLRGLLEGDALLVSAPH
jgi:putative hydrolase of the HAD superfamily